MSLALFDLDHTLLNGDTNTLWLNFLVDNGHLNADVLDSQADYMVRYAAEELDIVDYLGFHLRLLNQRPIVEWLPVRAAFVATQIVPRLSVQGFDVVAAHRAQGDRMAIITATHRFLSFAIGEQFDLPVIAPTPEIRGGHFTGRIEGSICFREEKLICLADWLKSEEIDALRGDSYFYSDSANDLPLLEAVSYPRAVNPDARLAALAKERNWPVLKWRSERSDRPA